jgi:hypothetical protein
MPKWAQGWLRSRVVPMVRFIAFPTFQAHALPPCNGIQTRSLPGDNLDTYLPRLYLLR